MSSDTVIKERMKALKYTQKKLAEQVNISQATLSNIINGKAEPSAELRNALASALRVTVADLDCAADEWKYWPHDFACPRCGSRAVAEFYNHADGSCRLSCSFCGLDTGDQKNRSVAMRLLASYKPPRKETAELSAARVFSVAELLDSSALDADDVRPVWFENRGLFCCPALLQYGIAERELELVRVQWWNANGSKSFELSKYGNWWRCWTQKPTEAQSNETAWVL